MMIGYKHFDFCTKVFLYERKRVYIFKQATYLFLFEYSLLVVWIQYILFHYFGKMMLIEFDAQ